jgi:hypothetical protein
MLTSDEGPDQQCLRRQLHVQYRLDPSVIVVDVSCVLHSGARIYKHHLDLVDSWLSRHGRPWKFYSSLAKLMLIWREKARLVFLVWASLFQHKAARYARLPPKCIAGRWGRISEVQRLNSNENMGGPSKYTSLSASLIARCCFMLWVWAFASVGRRAAAPSTGDPPIQN